MTVRVVNPRHLFWALCFVLQFVPATIATTATNWTNPNGKLSSFSDSFTVGEHIILSWLALNNSLSDLWLTRYNTSPDDFALRLAVSLDVSIANSFTWIIAVSEEEVRKDTRFMFQFVPNGVAYDPSLRTDLASPGINLLLVNQQTPPNGSVSPSSAPTTQTSSTDAPLSTATTSLGSPQSSQISGTQAKSSGISTGVKAGIALAALSFVLATALVCFVVWKRRHRRITDISNGSGEKMVGPYEMLADRRQPIELNSKRMGLETSDSQDTITHELYSIVKRPGLHELPS